MRPGAGRALRRWLSGAWLALAACPPALAADAPVRVRSLAVEGASAVAADELEAQMLTRERGWKLWQPRPAFDEEVLREDLDRIVGHYRERGYYEARAAYALEWNAERTRASVTVRVEEGEPVRLASLRVDVPPGPWLEPDARAELVEELPLVEGQIFGALVYREAREELLRRLGDRGHPAAALEGGARVELESRSARVEWRVLPGPRVHFGPVEVEGLVDVEEPLVRRELDFEPGEVFSRTALDASQRQVYGVGLFRAVTVQARRPEAAARGAPPEPAAEQQRVAWPIVVRVEERPPRTVRLAVGYGTEDEFRTRASWRHRNFFGEARSLELAAKYSSLVQGAEVQFSQPRFFDPKIRLDVDASFVRETEVSFDANRVSTGLTLTRPLVGAWQGRTGYRFEYADVTDLEADDPEAAESSRLSSLLFGLGRTTVDDLLEPHSGTRLDLSVTPTLRALGSDRGFTTFEAEGRLFVPVSRAVLALRLRLGAIAPHAGTERDEVPIFKRFFSGGSNSVRGFDFQKLGPLDDDGDPLGGLTRTEGSAELRFPIWWILGGVAFFDAGQVARAPFHFELDEVFYAAGTGFRVKTPVGSLGLDWGYALRRPPGADPWRLHFSVGATF